MLGERILIRDDCRDDVEWILDAGGFDYDWDTGDRLMVSSEYAEEIEEILTESNIDCRLL